MGAYLGGWKEATLSMTSSGYQEGDSWVAWVEFFIKQTGGNCILITDNHSTRMHPVGLELLIKANVTLLTLHPHTTHVSQPLDRAFFRSLKHEFRSRVNLMRSSSTPITKSNIAQPLKGAWEAATKISYDPVTGAKCANVISGFEVTGIWPFNPSKLLDNKKVTGLADKISAAKAEAAAAAAAAAGGDAEDEEEVVDDVVLEDDPPMSAEAQAATVSALLTIAPDTLKRLAEHNRKHRTAQKSEIMTDETFVQMLLVKSEKQAAEAAKKDANKAAREMKRKAKEIEAPPTPDAGDAEWQDLLAKSRARVADMTRKELAELDPVTAPGLKVKLRIGNVVHGAYNVDLREAHRALAFEQVEGSKGPGAGAGAGAGSSAYAMEEDEEEY